MALGRAFAEGDAQGDGNQIVIADGLWRRRFGGRPDVVNSTTTLDGHDVTIVGVAPAALRFPARRGVLAAAHLQARVTSRPGHVAHSGCR